MHYENQVRTITLGMATENEDNGRTKVVKDVSRSIIRDMRHRDLSIERLSRGIYRNITVDEQLSLLMCVGPRDWGKTTHAQQKRLSAALNRVINSPRDAILLNQRIPEEVMTAECKLFRRPCKSKRRKLNGEKVPQSSNVNTKEEDAPGMEPGFLDTTCSNLYEGQVNQFKMDLCTETHGLLRFTQRPESNDFDKSMSFQIIWNATDVETGRYDRANFVESTYERFGNKTPRMTCRGCDTWRTDIRMQQEELHVTHGHRNQKICETGKFQDVISRTHVLEYYNCGKQEFDG
jgi:hypothetical protein